MGGAGFLLLLAGATVAPTSAKCANGIWEEMAFPERCHVHGNNMVVKCDSRFSYDCGTELVSQHMVVGQGTLSQMMQGANGPGAATSFFLSTPKTKDENQHWNQINFVILGKECAADSTEIYTSFFSAQNREHSKSFAVPFDACSSMHTYTFQLSTSSIEWVIDGTTFRQESIDDFWDIKDSVINYRFRAHLSLWGKCSTSPSGQGWVWGKMGELDDNSNEFPLTSRFNGAWNVAQSDLESLLESNETAPSTQLPRVVPPSQTPRSHAAFASAMVIGALATAGVVCALLVPPLQQNVKFQLLPQHEPKPRSSRRLEMGEGDEQPE